MIVSNDNAESRIHNPMNLINRMNDIRNKANSANNRNSAMSLFGVRRGSASSPIAEPLKANETAITIPTFVNPFEKVEETVTEQVAISPVENHPRVEDLIDDSDNKVKLATAHNNALDLLNSAVKELKNNLENVGAAKLPGVITAASKVVESIRRERLEISKSGKDKEVHYHFYTPEVRKIEQYETIDV
jgi:hypothetical protein